MSGTGAASVALAPPHNYTAAAERRSPALGPYGGRPAARSVSSMRLRNSPRSRSLKLDVFVFDREVVDAALGRRDPAGHPARLDHALHEGMDEGAVRLRRDPLREAPVVVFF